MKTKYFQFKDTIVVHVNNKTITIHRSDKRYENVLAAIQEGKDVAQLADNEASEELRALLKIRSRKT